MFGKSLILKNSTNSHKFWSLNFKRNSNKFLFPLNVTLCYLALDSTWNTWSGNTSNKRVYIRQDLVQDNEAGYSRCRPSWRRWSRWRPCGRPTSSESLPPPTTSWRTTTTTSTNSIFSFPEPISFRRTIDQSKQLSCGFLPRDLISFFHLVDPFSIYFYFCSAICFSPRSGKKQVCVTGAWRPSFSCHHHCRGCCRCCRYCCRRCCLSILCPNHTWIFQLSLSVFVPFWIKFDSFILRFLFCFVRYAKFRTGTEPLTLRISHYYCWPQCRTQFKQNFSFGSVCFLELVQNKMKISLLSKYLLLNKYLFSELMLLLQESSL